ncbi:nuclear transport factor 2 family protein [Sphingomonas sp. ID0503]|uniref:nuclear transport factor 2 family protein n=1 Tax=Sphingomonas sp. ID0503 TaxID=3399691 RepID=UPI003AFA5C47
MEVFSSGDADGVAAMMDPDATWWVAGTMPISGTYTREEFRALLVGVSDACDGPIRLIPHEFTIDGDRVAVETESMAQTLNGRTYNNFYHFLFILKGDKVLRVKEYLDTMHTNAVLCTP